MRALAALTLACAGCAASPAGPPPPPVGTPSSVVAPSAPAPAASSAPSSPADVLAERGDEARKAVAAALKIPVERLRVPHGGAARPAGRWLYAAAADEATKGKAWLVALRRCEASVCVAPPIAAPLPTITIAGYVDLEGEPRDDLAGAGVSVRLWQEPDRMKHPALWVRAGEAGKGSVLLLIDVAGGGFTKVLEETLAAHDAGGSQVIRAVALERGDGAVLDLVLVGEALPPPGEGGHPGPPLRFRHRWKAGAYARQ